MTPDSIKNSLLPYLESIPSHISIGLIKKEDDEVVFAITEELANVGPALGAQHTIVLPILESLCAHDETVVRDRAVKSITKLIERYTDNDTNNFILPLVRDGLMVDYQVGFQLGKFYLPGLRHPSNKQRVPQSRPKQIKTSPVPIPLIIS